MQYGHFDNKRKEYVYLMTKIYRTAIDNYFEGKKLFTKEDIILIYRYHRERKP